MPHSTCERGGCHRYYCTYLGNDKINALLRANKRVNTSCFLPRCLGRVIGSAAPDEDQAAATTDLGDVALEKILNALTVKT